MREFRVRFGRSGSRTSFIAWTTLKTRPHVTPEKVVVFLETDRNKMLNAIQMRRNWKSSNLPGDRRDNTDFLNSKVLTQIEFLGAFVCENLIGCTGGNDDALIHYVGPGTHCKGFPHIVIRDKNAYISLAEHSN